MSTSKFFTNRNGNTLMQEFNNIFEANPAIRHLDAVVGFLRSSGYFTLRPFLDNITKVRVLIGIDVDKYIVKAERRGKLFQGAEEEVKAECSAKFKADIEASHYSNTVEQGIWQMYNDLITGKLELRAHPSRHVHSKIYVLYPEGFNEHSLGAAAITGSSNLSGNGLGISQEKQYEFNVRLQDTEEVMFAKQEFEELWAEAEGCPIEATDFKDAVDQTYLAGDATPYEVYIKMLIEYFAERIGSTEREDPFEMPTGYKKMDYQIDAVIEGYQKLIRYDGFILADVVGLGKTIVATMVAKKFLIENGRDNTKILVVFPPAVENNWKETFHSFGIDKYTRFCTNGRLEHVLDPDDVNFWNPEEYDLVIVDEAHKYRNHDTGVFKALQEICKMPRTNVGDGVPGYKKKVMLLSATPMNNSPLDLYHEIILFQDPRRCTIDGISNLTNFFAPLIKEFKKLKRDPDYNMQAFKQLAERVRERVIKPITVRRTRADIESVARYKKDVEEFPKVDKPIKNEYVMTPEMRAIFIETMQIIVEGLTYARYQAIAGLKPEVSRDLYESAETISKSLASISKISMVKRLESSYEAFKLSLSRLNAANRNMIDMFDKGKVYIAPDLDINALYAEGLTDEEIEERVRERGEKNPKNACFKPSDFRDGFYDELLADQQYLDLMVERWNNVGDADDTKYDVFSLLLKTELMDAERNPGQKLVIFSESFETVQYLERRINRKDVLVISAANRNQSFRKIRENFDANYTGVRRNDYNIILTTDVLAEGVNLHRSNVIVNYDTPWNSTKLMQRIGRVNRIGSVCKRIYNYVFYPSNMGDQYINLKRTSLAKLQTFHSTFGEDNQIYSTQEIIDFDLDKLFEVSSQPLADNPEIPFYEELLDLYKNHHDEYVRISELSTRSRTGRESLLMHKPELAQTSLVFLKTNLRKRFYRVSDDKAEQITAVDAFTLAKTTPDEPRAERISQHHDHVQRAIDKFNADIVAEIQNEEFLQQQSRSANAGADINTSLALLRTLTRLYDDEAQRQLIVRLQQVVERAVIASLPTQIVRIDKDLKRHVLTADQAKASILELATKYSVYYIDENATAGPEESEPEVRLSESFC